MARPSRNYKEYLLQRLRDPAEAAEYIDGALEDGDIPGLLLAMRDVAEARGIGTVAARAGLDRVNLYRILSDKGNPRLSSFLPLLDALGVELKAKSLRPTAVRSSVAATLASNDPSMSPSSSVLEEYEEGNDHEGARAADEQSLAA